MDLSPPRTTLAVPGQLTAAFGAELLFACALAYIVLNVAAPAVDLSVVMSFFDWPTLWIYAVVELVAGAAAGFAFRALNVEDKQAN